MNIDILIRHPEDRPMVEYVAGVWKSVSCSSVTFSIKESVSSIASAIFIAYGFRVSPLSGKRCLFLPRKHIDSGWKYSTLQLSPDIAQDPRLNGEVLPVFSKTTEDGLVAGCSQGHIALRADIIFNAFAHLALLEEKQRQRGGKNIFSYASKLRADRRWLHKPVVNYYFAVLERCLELLGIERSVFFPYAKTATVCLTHDVDVLRKNVGYVVKQTALQGMNLLRRPHEVLSIGANIYRRCIKGWQHDGIDAVVEMERKHGVRSTFFLSGSRAASRTGGMSTREKLIEPAYDLSREDSLSSRMTALANDSWEIGVHGGAGSHADADRLNDERKCVETVCQKPVVSGRQHWLTFSHSESCHTFSSAGIAMDCTLGFNDQIGFRSGVCHSYTPYNEIDCCAHQTIAVPMVVMDSTLFDYQSMPEEEANTAIDDILSEINKFSGTISVLWHNHAFVVAPLWERTYVYLLARCIRNEISMSTVAAILTHRDSQVGAIPMVAK